MVVAGPLCRCVAGGCRFGDLVPAVGCMDRLAVDSELVVVAATDRRFHEVRVHDLVHEELLVLVRWSMHMTVVAATARRGFAVPRRRSRWLRPRYGWKPSIAASC